MRLSFAQTLFTMGHRMAFITVNTIIIAALRYRIMFPFTPFSEQNFL